jgi:hypothetical protein
LQGWWLYEHLKQLPNLTAQPGYLDVTFTAGGESKHFRTMFQMIRAALEQGLSGQALILAIASP